MPPNGLVGMVPPDLVQQWISSAPPVALPASAPAAVGAAVLEPVPAASASTTADPVVAASAPALEARAVLASPVAPVPATVPVQASAAAASAPAVARAGVLRLAASADSWIEVVDAQGQPVFSRILQRGEAVAVDASPPLRMRVGNAAGTSVAFRGQTFDLAPYTRDNVARVELR